jgi:leader peptidase (prepilin peptidase)/N-methyltransferase
VTIDMIDFVLYFFIGLLGASIGSFLNVVISRVPQNRSIITPRSSCPKCDHQISWYDNIPIISFVFLRGECRYCSSKISFLYPFVEALSALLAIAIFHKLGITLESIMLLCTFYTLIALSFIDLKLKAVPDYMLILAFIFAILSSSNTSEALKNGFIFAGAFAILELFVTFYIQNIKYRITKNEDLKDQIALGEGDIPIVAIIGAVLGIKLGITAILVGALTAMIPSIYNLVTKKDIETPFIPYLSLGLVIVYFCGDFDILGAIVW